MKTKLFFFSILILSIPSLVLAHGDLGDGDEHHEDEEKTVFIEPCEIGSVIKCGGHGNDGHSQSLDQVINDLLVGFDVKSVDKLDCSEIVDHDFGHVGEALMGYMHPDENEHAKIDELMGGEGSDELELMHIFMGKRYLGCDDKSFGPMMMNFSNDAGGIMMGRAGVMPGQYMVGMLGMPFTTYGFNAWMGVVQIIFWFLAFIGFAWVIRLIVKKVK